MTLQVITFPGAQVSDIPACLRDLAENIEAGNFGEAITLLWQKKFIKERKNG